MTLLKRIALIALSFATMVSCKSTKTLLPNVSGKAGEVIVVMDKDVWEASAGEEVRSLLGSACPYLPQREALHTSGAVSYAELGGVYYFNYCLIGGYGVAGVKALDIADLAGHAGVNAGIAKLALVLRKGVLLHFIGKAVVRTAGGVVCKQGFLNNQLLLLI